VESAERLLGWVEETWLGASDEPVALAVRTVDGRDGLLVAEDVEAVARESELVTMRPGTRLLELQLPRVEASGNRLVASWRATGDPLEPQPHPPGVVDRALLAVRPWRLAPPPKPAAERPLWQQIAILYTALAFIVILIIVVAFATAWIAAGSAY
jgi:hypothetical protein